MRNFRVVSIAGIPIYLNITLVLFLPVLGWLISRPEQIAAYAGFIELFAGRPVDAAALSSGSTPLVLGAGGAVGLMVGVLIHELGHSWAARRYDIEIVSITLWIFGGMARMDDLPEDWGIEFWVALAGPVTSVLLSALFLGVLQVTPASAPIATFVVGWLAVVNLSLAVFNMIPAFPMDGGRILRALLARNRDYASATLIAASIAKAFAIMGAIVAVLGGAPLLILISLFVYVAATSESRATVLRQLLADFTARDLMGESRPVATSTSVTDLLDRVLDERRTTFPVVDGGAPLGVASLDHARSVSECDRSTTTVGDVMDRSVATVSPDRTAFEIILEMGEAGQDTVFVVEDGELLGVITQADIAAAIEVIQGVSPRQQPMPDPPEGYA
jgi:Zn-dependent protease/predicted transcriptional regulator